MKIAIVHEWLITYGGAEVFVHDLLNIFPEADIFAVVDFLNEKDRFLISKN